MNPPRRQISRFGYLQLQLLELFTHNLKTKQHLALHKARAVLRLNIPGRRQLKMLLTIDERG